MTPNPEDSTEYSGITSLEAPAFPHEFVEALADDGVDVLNKWLASNGAPKAALDVISALSYFLIYLPDCEDNLVPRHENFCVREVVAEMVNAIALLGGTFHSCVGNTNPREPVKWAAPTTLASWLATYESLSESDQREARLWMRDLVAPVKSSRPIDNSGR